MRMAAHERVELADQLGVVPELELGIDPLLEAGEPVEEEQRQQGSLLPISLTGPPSPAASSGPRMRKSTLAPSVLPAARVSVARRRERLVEASQHGRQGAGELSAGGRQRDASARADEERRSELALELVDAVAERRGSDGELPGGAGEVELVRDGQEVAELAQLDHARRSNVTRDRAACYERAAGVRSGLAAGDSYGGWEMSIGIVGSGVAGLHLGLFLRQHDVPVTIYTDKTAEEVAGGRIQNTVAHHATTVERERALGVHFWDAAEHGYVAHYHYFGGEQPLYFRGDFAEPSSCIDYRLYLPRLMAELEERTSSASRGTTT
jgi:hypothetical protein